MATYNTQLLKSIEACDRFIADKQHEKSEIEFDKAKMTGRQASSSTSNGYYSQVIQETQAAIDALDIQIAAMPEGDSDRMELEARRFRLYSKKINTELKMTASDGEILLDREYKLSLKDQAIAEIDMIVGLVEARKVELTV